MSNRCRSVKMNTRFRRSANAFPLAKAILPGLLEFSNTGQIREASERLVPPAVWKRPVRLLLDFSKMGRFWLSDVSKSGTVFGPEIRERSAGMSSLG